MSWITASVCVHMHAYAHTRANTHTTMTNGKIGHCLSYRFSSLHSIIHAVCGLAGTLFISWLDLVLLSGTALQKQ